MKKRKAPSSQGAGFNLPIGSVVTFIIMGAAAYSLSWEQTAERLSAAGSAVGSIVSGALLRQGITAVFGSGSYLHALVFPLLVLCSLLVLILLIRAVYVYYHAREFHHRRRRHNKSDIELHLANADDLEYREVHVHVRGRHIYQQTFQPIGASTNPNVVRGVVIAMHGYGSDSVLSLKTHVRALVHQGFVVDARDFYGHGRSEGVAGHFRVPDLVHDLHDHIEAVRARPEVAGKPIFLLGVSLGGHVALHYTRQYKQDIAGLVLLCPTVTLAKEAIPPRIIVEFGRLFGLLFPEFPFAAGAGSRGWTDKQAHAQYTREPLAYHGRLRIATGFGILHSVQALEKQLHLLTTPMLIQHGRFDRIASVTGSELLYEKAASADKELIIYEDCNHALLEEPNGRGQRVAHDFIAWLVARVGGEMRAPTASVKSVRAGKSKHLDHAAAAGAAASNVAVANESLVEVPLTRKCSRER